MEKTHRFILWIGLAIANILLFFIGYKSEGFVNISLMGLLGFDVTIIVSVYLVQSLVDKRRKAEYIVRILDSVAKDFENEYLFSHAEKDKAKTIQTYIENRLYYVNEAAPKRIKNDSEYIYNEFLGAREHFDDHPDERDDDIFYIKKKACILGKIAKIQLTLFDFDVKDKAK